MTELWQGLNWFQRVCLIAIPVLAAFEIPLIVNALRSGTELRESPDPLPETAIRHFVKYRIIETLSLFVGTVAFLLSNLLDRYSGVYIALLFLFVVCMVAVPPIARRRLGILEDPTDSATGWAGVALCYASYGVLIVLLAAAGFVGVTLAGTGAFWPGMLVLVLAGAGIAACVFRLVRGERTGG